MKAIAALLLFFVSAQQVLGFATPVSARSLASRPLFADTSTLTSLEADERIMNTPLKRVSSASLAGIITGITGFVGQVLAEEEYEMAELPPAYIPALFGVVLLGGVGFLTLSLGNVMDEGKLLLYVYHIFGKFKSFNHSLTLF